MSDAFEELRSRLEGKTVLKVTNPGVAECICHLTMSDGTGFRLHATDLGYWIEEAENAEGFYTCVSGLCRAYGHHAYNLSPKHNFEELPQPKLTIDEEKVIAEACDGRAFTLLLAGLPARERQMLRNPKAMEVLTGAICSGDLWLMHFDPARNKDLPPDMDLVTP